MTDLLIKEPPLQVLPSLAVAIGLKPALVLQQLYWLSQRSPDGWVTKSVPRWRREFPFLSDVTVKRTFARLRELGLVDHEEAEGQFDRTNRYRPNLEAIGALASGSTRSTRRAQRAPAQTDLLSIQERTSTTETSTADAVDELRSRRQNDPTETETIRRVFRYWQNRCNHPMAKLSSERQSKIRARLREGRTAEEFKQAIDGAAVAPFVNDRGKAYDDIELICRNAAKFEDFMDRAAPTQNNGGGKYGHLVQHC